LPRSLRPARPALHGRIVPSSRGIVRSGKKMTASLEESSIEKRDLHSIDLYPQIADG
jgi:hypothetical protein